MKKMNLKAMQDSLSRSEMKNIMAGSGGCYSGQGCFSAQSCYACGSGYSCYYMSGSPAQGTCMRM